MSTNGNTPLAVNPELPMDWWRDRTAVIELLYDLHDRGEIVTASDAIHVIEKPQKYRMEMLRYLRERPWEDVG